MENLFAPTDGIMAGVLRRNHLATLERGPWRFAGVREPKWETVRDADAAGGFAEVQAVQGTCDCCSSPIKDVAVFRSESGERITLGLDCAQTFRKHLAGGSAKLDAATKARRRVKAAAAKARKAQRVIKAHEALLGRLDALSAAEGFAGRFARSVARQVRSGKVPSEKQLVLIERLEGEVQDG